MTPFKDRVDSALKETQTLILGAEILFGFEYGAFFQSGFSKLSDWMQALRLVALSLMLITVALLIAPAPFHHLAEKRQDTPRLLGFTARMAGLALLPFALALAIDVASAFQVVGGAASAVAGGAAAVLFALLLWYGLEVIDRVRLPGERPEGRRMQKDKRIEQEQTGLDEKIKEALTEIRIALPGIQAVLGFQFAVILTDEFGKLPDRLQQIHVAAIIPIGLSALFLMAPSAYHRIVEQGENTPHFLKVAGRMTLAALALLPFGFALDFYVVIEKTLKSTPLALFGAAATLIVYLGLWFGYSYLVRSRRRSAPAAQPAARRG
ncbi:MAG: DUF6328 family protein [Rudaea sp.]